MAISISICHGVWRNCEALQNVRRNWGSVAGTFCNHVSGLDRRYILSPMSPGRTDYDLRYIDLEEKTLQPLQNPFGPKV
jgi:hypothetical protein